MKNKENMPLEQAKNNVLTALSENDGTLTESEFDNIFCSGTVQKIINGKNVCERVFSKYRVFAPLWFVCANIDQSHAFHLYAIKALIKDGKVNKGGKKYCRCGK